MLGCASGAIAVVRALRDRRRPMATLGIPPYGYSLPAIQPPPGAGS